MLHHHHRIVARAAALTLTALATAIVAPALAQGVPTNQAAQTTAPGNGQQAADVSAAPSIQQSSTEAAPTDAQTETAPDVVVTGTLIRGIKTPTGSALQTVGTEAIRGTGATSAGDVLNQTVTQLPSFNTAAVGTPGIGNAVTKIGLRGIGNTQGSGSGQTATLVLVNGHRIVPVGVLSTDPDPDLLPADVLDNVQIMPDGGSATYGSDAIGGVVNFVTKKRLDGLQLRYEHRFADAYNENTVTGTLGKSWSSGAAYLSAIYNNHGAIFGRDRGYITSNFTSKGGQDYRLTACGYGQFAVNGTTYVAPGFNAVAAPPVCDQTDNAGLVPKQSRVSVFGYVEQQITDNLKFSMDALYSRRRTDVYTATALASTVTITSANPYFHRVGTETSQDVSFNYSRGLGASRVSPQTFSQYQFDPSLSWNVDGNWRLQADVLVGRSYTRVRDRTGINSAAVNANTINPYDTAATDPSVLAALNNYEINSTGDNGITSGQLVANGTIFQIAGGDVRVAVGGEIRRQTLYNTSATGAIGKSPDETASAGRTIAAGFGEVFVPLVGAANGGTLLRELSVDAAVRYDHYSDFGGTTNPRIGVNYRPFKDLLIRGNYQTSFVAPSLADSGTRFQNVFQVFTVIPNYYLVFIAGAGQNVQPETGKTFSAGFDYTPSAVPGLKVGTTYWNTRVDNLVSLSLAAYGFLGSFSTSYNVCGTGFAGVFAVSPNGACTAAKLAAVRSTYNTISAGGAPGINSIADLLAPGVNVTGVIDARRGNFGIEKINGLDAYISYQHDVSFGTIYADASGTYILNKKIAAVPGAPYVDYLSGQTVDGSTPRYNIVGSLGTSSGPFVGRLTVRHNAGYTIPVGQVVNQNHVSSYTLFDLYLSADLQKLAGLRSTTLAVTIQNLFDQDPPYYGANPAVGSVGGFANGSTLGRTVGVSIQHRF